MTPCWPRFLACCAIGALAVLPAARSLARSLASSAPAAWAMPGHDPQRTAQGVAVGPQHAVAPHLVLKSFTSNPPIIGADGTLYGFIPCGARGNCLAAVSPAGMVRWTTSARLPRWWSAEPPDQYAVLAPDGSITFGGGACPRPAHFAGTDGCLTTVRADGSPREHMTTHGLTKAGPQLLVEPNGSLVRATLGPASGFINAADDAQRNVTIYAPSGAARRLGAGCSWVNTALGAAATLYAIAAKHEGGPCPTYAPQPGPTGESIVAFTPGGARAWVTPLPIGCSATTLAIDSRRGRIYAAVQCSTPGTQVYALDTRGRVRWVAHAAGDIPAPALALDRASGDVWLADGAGVQRLSTAGMTRWRRDWRGVPGSTRATIALDARDTAYASGGDGLLHAIGSGGTPLWQYRFTAPRGMPGVFQYAPPSPALGPDGRLYVSGGTAGMVVFAP